MKESLTKRILKEKNLRSTIIRNEILSIFEKKNYALSYNDLDKELNSKFDMATVYRTLNTFVENKIIHQIPLDSKTAYYALSRTTGGKDGKRKEHIHFVCTNCCHTFCLEDVWVSEIKLKKNFHLESLKVIAEGICDSCNNKC